MKTTKILGYTRVSTETQTNTPQKTAILDYAFKNGLQVNKIIETTVTSKKDKKYRLINETIAELEKGDTLLVYALDRLGRSTIETLTIIEEIKTKGIILIFIKDNLVINPNNQNPMNEMLLTMLSGFAQLERSFISERTKAGLEARKKVGVILGRKKGTQGKTMYDEYKIKITELVQLGLPLPKIIDYIQIGKVSSLRKYIKTREIA